MKNKRPAMKSMSASLFVAVWFESKSGQSLQVTCFDPGMQIMFLRHHKEADIVLLFGLCFPVSCFRSTRANTPLTQVRLQDHLLCLAWKSHGTMKARREATSAGLLWDGTLPNQVSQCSGFSNFTNSVTIPLAASVASSALTNALRAALLFE